MTKVIFSALMMIGMSTVVFAKDKEAKSLVTNPGRVTKISCKIEADGKIHGKVSLNVPNINENFEASFVEQSQTAEFTAFMCKVLKLAQNEDSFVSLAITLNEGSDTQGRLDSVIASNTGLGPNF